MATAGVPPEAALVSLRPAILSILRSSDLSEVSAKKVRLSLETDGLLQKAGIDTDVKTHKRAVDEQIRVCFDHVSSGAPLPGPAPASAAPVAFGGIALPGMGGIPGGGASAASASNGHPSSAPSSSAASASKKRKKVKGEDEISSGEEEGGPAPKAKKSSSSKKSSGSKKSKASDGEKKAPNPNNPFNRPVVLSDDMAAMCGGKEMPRYMITKKLWEYIKGKDLQNPENKREILCDDRLKHLFGKPKVDSFEMAKLITKHVSKKET